MTTLYPCEVCLLNRHDRCNGWRQVIVLPDGDVARCGCSCIQQSNVHCSNCGSTRGGPVGHEISECYWNPRPQPRPTTEENPMPKRVQMTRNRPWRADNPDAVIVDRSTKWGNPWTVRDAIAHDIPPAARQAWLVHRYRLDVAAAPQFADEARRDLAGRDLACWCKPADQCHADVLLEIANQEPQP